MCRVLPQIVFLTALLSHWPTGRDASAQGLTATLLRQICEPKDIRGNECTNAKDYPEGSPCSVKLNDDRKVGRYVAAQTILLVGYESDCEPRANKFGGSLVFEHVGQSYVFNSYHPGLVPLECVSLPGASGDRLICLTGHAGQGFMESAIAEVVFIRDASKAIESSYDELASATDSAGAYGVNKIECKEPRVLFGFSKLAPGPAAGTVLVTVEYADRAAIAQACRRGAPKPKDAIPGAKAGRGEAFIDPKLIKSGRFALDLATKELQPR